MTSFQVQVRAVPRAQLPTDAALQERLVRLVREGVEHGRDAPSVIVVRERTVDALDPRPVLAGGLSLPWLVTALAGSTTLPGGDAVAVGLVGKLTWRPPDAPPAEVALAFLEWPDNRWWQWQGLLDDAGRLRPDTVAERASARGDALPDGLGRWWSAARRSGQRLVLAPVLPAGDGGVEH